MPDPSVAPTSRPPSAWRRCVLLCLPALVLGAILRLSLLTALPEGYYGPDSNSYFDTTSALWLKHKWDMGPKRRWVYPLLLIPTPILPGRNIATIAVIQHTFGLLVTVLGMGWITLNLTGRPLIWVPFVTILAALWPRMIWYEHEIVAEPVLLASIILAVALAFPVQRLRDPKRLFWFLMAAALIIAVKPHGRPIWLGLMLSGVLLAGFPWRWSKACWAALALSVVIILNTGSSRQGPWLLLSSALPLVNTEQGKWPEYRQILRPRIEEARVDISQYPWHQDRYKKMLNESKDKATLGPEWQALVADRKKFLQVCKDLAVDAIEHAPLTYVRMVLQKIGMVFSDDESGWRMAPRGFWKSQLEDNEDRWTRHPDEMKLLYEMDQDAYLALAGQRRAQVEWYEPYVYGFTRAFAWMHTVRAGTRTLHPAWFGVLALFGFLTCLRPSRWRETSLLWLPLGLYLAIIFGIGDSVVRYLQPIEWVGIIFVALGLDWVLGLVWRSPAPALEAPASSPPNAASAS
ncbi:MAG: hypothetical protein ABJF10_18075 [Chthoniobacter sp.]|uniref:hypothetical protein n=1 Tax=Chthoniobacter sp. TaxID=2510640 RepID=UPI0032A79574